MTTTQHDLFGNKLHAVIRNPNPNSNKIHAIGDNSDNKTFCGYVFYQSDYEFMNAAWFDTASSVDCKVCRRAIIRDNVKTVLSELSYDDLMIEADEAESKGLEFAPEILRSLAEERKLSQMPTVTTNDADA